jgi:hypothetical protein
MPGLDDPRIRRASPKNFAVLATALQSRPTALFFGPRDSRIAPPSSRAAPTPEALFRPRKSSGGAPRNERTSPRVHPLGPCRLNAVNFCGAHSRRRGDSVLVCSERSNSWNNDYRAILTSASVNQSDVPTQLPIIHSAKQLSHLKAGDIVVMHPRSGHVRTLFRPDSEHNALLVTERCNSFCLMCSQPPLTVTTQNWWTSICMRFG